MSRPTPAKWKGFFNVMLTHEDLMILTDQSRTFPHEEYETLLTDALDNHYQLTLRAFGYNAPYVAELYGKYSECINAGLKLTAEAATLELAIHALILKVKRYPVWDTWPWEENTHQNTAF